MIKLIGVTKEFDDIKALNNINLEIKDGSICALAGSNGSGKSTMLRCLAGVYRCEEGQILIDGEEVYDNPKIKEICYFIPDFPFYYYDSTLDSTRKLMKGMYENWSDETYEHLIEITSLPRDKKIINMSKGMQRQASLIIAFSTKPKYFFMDEIFDGLDPVVRNTIKKIMVECSAENNTTCIVASHNMREVDDVCDEVIFLHNGKLVENQDKERLKESLNKIQIAFSNVPDPKVFAELNCEVVSQTGGYFVLMAKGDLKEIEDKLKEMNPDYIETIGTSLEEVFINKMEEAGYGK